MAEFGLGGGVDLLRRRATVARLTIYAFVIACLGVVIGNGLESAGIINLYEEYPDELSGLFAIVYLLALTIFIGSVVTVSMWIHRAHANLVAAGIEDLEYTPGWSVGWFFIPIANLFKPFQAMRELWVRSHGIEWDSSQDTPSLLSAWWGTWLGGNILSNVGSRIAESGNATAGGLLSGVGAALLILAAILLLRIINEVTRAQTAGTISAHAFA